MLKSIHRSRAAILSTFMFFLHFKLEIILIIGHLINCIERITPFPRVGTHSLASNGATISPGSASGQLEIFEIHLEVDESSQCEEG